ncbi:MAG: fused response regulator/phosphatase [Pseudomonadota bacterium]
MELTKLDSSSMGGALRILVADDNDSDRLILSRIVKSQGNDVRTAVNGQEAIDLFKEWHPDIVLMDALMPEVDGFQAAKEIRILSGEDIIPIIFLTSLRDTESLAQCLEAGGTDFLSKPYNRTILEAKINAFGRLRRLQQTVKAQRDRLEMHHGHLLREQEAAKRVFDNIAHPGCIASNNIKYLLSPMAVFNGDMVLAAKKPDGGIYVMLGDFTGHGLPAAIGAMPASEIFYGMAVKGFSAPEILREINKKLERILPKGFFCCLGFVDFCFDRGIIQVWNGGLPDIFLYRKLERDIVKISSKNLPIGILTSEKFRTQFDVYEIRSGDRVFLWSDGIHEAKNANDEMFGTHDLEKVFFESEIPQNLFENILDSVKNFTGGRDQDDDYTIIEITCVDQNSEAFEENLDTKLDAEQKSRPKNAGPLDWSLSYQLRPQTLKQFDPLPLLTHIILEVPGLKPYSGRIYTLLAELYSNALEHGVLDIQSVMKNSAKGFAEYYQMREERLQSLNNGTITFYLEHIPTEQGGVLTIRIEDTGKGFDYKAMKNSEDKKNKSYCGRGIPLIASLTQELQYFAPGNIVEAKFTWAYENAAS